MCGIAGIIQTPGNDLESMEDSLMRMMGTMSHRGPDGEGSWISPDKVAALAHTRLSILDLTEAGRQPMASADGRFQITFNGEIYNFRELRKHLVVDHGHVPTTQSDTEVLIELYARYGSAVLPMLRGMYAFAVWDCKEQTCFLARDPLGIKPLYFSVRRGRLTFGSELRTVMAAPGVRDRLDPEALLGFFERGSVAEPATLVADVHCLEAGHFLTWKAGKWSKERHWRIEFPSTPVDRSDPILQTRTALLESVEAHLVSDVPVGLFLSGGMDSTAILALARELGSDPLRTFSIGVDDSQLDESHRAQRTAAHYGTEHTECVLDANAVNQMFQNYLSRMDQPSIDGLNTYSISQVAHQNGMKAVMSGLGGDELFGGYRSFESVPRLFSMSRRMARIPGLSPALGFLFEGASPFHRLQRVGSLLKRPPSINSSFRCFRGLFSTRDARIVASKYLDCHPSDVPEGPIPAVSANHPKDAVSECEFSQYMRNQLLRDTDSMSMAHSLELRVPFVDQRLFDSLAQIPAKTRLRPGKQLLREVLPDMPKWVIEGPKRGFTFPFQRWLEKDWSDAMHASQTKLQARRPTWYQSWAVFILDQWLERHPLG